MTSRVPESNFEAHGAELWPQLCFARHAEKAFRSARKCPLYALSFGVLWSPNCNTSPQPL